VAVHFILDPGVVDGHAQRIERSLGEFSQESDCLARETMKCDRRARRFSTFPTTGGSIDELAQRREPHAKGAGIVFDVRRHDTAPVQREKKFLDGGPDHGHTADTVTTASGNDQHFLASAHLLLAQPRIGMPNGVRSAWKMLSKIQGALGTKTQLVGRAHGLLRGDFELLVGEVS
jgi:hypothetical protein